MTFSVSVSVKLAFSGQDMKMDVNNMTTHISRNNPDSKLGTQC